MKAEGNRCARPLSPRTFTEERVPSVAVGERATRVADKPLVGAASPSGEEKASLLLSLKAHARL